MLCLRCYPSVMPLTQSAACSEPEAAAVRDVAVAFRPHAWVNVHSGMEGLFMPYDHVAEIPDGPDAARCAGDTAGAPGCRGMARCKPAPSP